MTEELPERDLLRTIDPAPRIIEAVDQERHLRLVMSRTRRLRRRFWTPRRLAVAASPAVALTAVALLFISLQAPPQPAPQHSVGPDGPTAISAGRVTRSGVRILAEQQVGDAVLLLGERDGQRRFGASFHGSDPDRNWDLFSPGPAAVDGMTVGEVSNFPTAAPGGIAVIAGAVGSDVVSIDVHTHAGRVEPASLADGLWLAAWNGRDFDDRSTLDTSFVLHLRNGSSKTVTYQQLSR